MHSTDVSEPESLPNTSGAGFLSGGGKMGALVRSHDWSVTAVGPVASWPQSLRTSLSILLDSGYAMYIAWGPAFTQFYNDAYRPILGARKHPGALGQSSEECFPEIWSFIGPMFRRVMELGENTTLYDQLLALDRNGYVEECYFTFSYSAIRDESGGVGGVLVTCIETTARVFEERRQRTLQQLAAEAIHSADAGDVLVRASRILSENPFDIPFSLLYRRTENVAMLEAFSGPDLGPATINLADAGAAWPLAAVISTGCAFFLTDIAPCFGEVIGSAWPEPVRGALLLPLRDASQASFSGFLITGINPRHALDDKYQVFLESAADQIAAALVRVRAYEEERRRAAALAELDKAKTTFFSNVSHEFRTPLTLMLGPLEEMLASGELSTRTAELVAVTHRNGLRLQKLVNTLLDFSRIEAGRVEASYEPVDLAGFTLEIASTFSSALENAGLEFNVDCAPLSSPALVDRDMWEKIVLNLLSNAFKYTFEGKVSVQIAERDGHAILTVSDTGTGIPAHELPHIFERFHRVEGARGRTQEGTGIGLALIAELVKLHSGTVHAESTEGAGSVFTVSIPLGDTQQPVVSPRATNAQQSVWLTEAVQWSNPAPASTPAASAEMRGRILVADDNADMRGYVTRLLSPIYEIETAANGEAALASIRAHPPDLVLSDIMMPGLDGFGLLQSVRNNPDTAALPVILLSARAGEEASAEGLDAGASDYLVKPFTARELLSRVGAHMEMVRVRAEGAAVERRLRADAQAARDEAVSILESITDGFFALDNKWCFTYVNSAGERLLRAPRAELLGRSHWDIFPEAVGGIGDREYRRALREQVPVEFEIFYEPFRSWYAIKAYPTSQGGLSVYLRDITEAKHNQADLERQWHLFDAALSHTPDHVYTFDLDARFTYANRAVLDLFQKSLSQLIGRGPFELEYPAGLAERIVGQIQEVVRTKTSLRDGTSFPDASADIRHFEYIFVPVLDSAGNVTAVAGSTRDVTDRERIESALIASEEKLQQVFTQAPVAIVAMRGREMRVELANSYYQSLLQGRQLVGRSLFEAVPELSQGVRDVLLRVYETGEPFIAESWPVPYDADGDGEIEDHWFNVVYNPLREFQGRVSGVIAVLTDVTAQVLSRRELERVNRDLEEFAYVASHDLQEPLRMVNTYTELLLRRHVSPENTEASHYAGFIHDGVHRMEQLIHDLLSYSRALYAGDVIPGTDDRVADLNASLADAISLLNDRIGEANARIVADTLPLVRGDKAAFSHVFQNLISNAVKYRRAEISPEIVITARRRDDLWIIEVRDNGIGFEQQYAERIFGLFKRLHREEYAGTGLGLAICQRLVERYDGRIHAEAQPGAGAAFFIELHPA